MLKDILKAILSYSRSFRYIRQGRLGWLAMAPGLLGTLLGAVYAYFAYAYSDELASLLLQWYPWESSIETAEYISSWLSFLLLLIIYLLLLKYIILIIGGPFMSPYSERIEEMITGEPSKASFSPTQFFRDLWRSARLNARNLLRELLLTIVLLLVSLIPIFSPFTSVLLFLLGAYYGGFGNMDFTMERHLNYKDSVSFVQRNRGIALGNGIVFMLIFLIPLVGIFIALPMATAAATESTVNKLQEEGSL